MGSLVVAVELFLHLPPVAAPHPQHSNPPLLLVYVLSELLPSKEESEHDFSEILLPLTPSPTMSPVVQSVVKQISWAETPTTNSPFPLAVAVGRIVLHGCAWFSLDAVGWNTQIDWLPLQDSYFQSYFVVSNSNWNVTDNMDTENVIHHGGFILHTMKAIVVRLLRFFNELHPTKVEMKLNDWLNSNCMSGKLVPFIR